MAADFLKTSFEGRSTCFDEFFGKPAEGMFFWNWRDDDAGVFVDKGSVKP